MRMFLVYLNVARMHRAIWHRKQHEKLIAKVGRYLKQVEDYR